MYRDIRIAVKCDEQEVYSVRRQIVTPGEMETLTLKPELLTGLDSCSTLRVELVKGTVPQETG